MAEVKDADSKLDKILTHLDATSKRLDAIESAHADSAKKMDSMKEKMDSEEKKKADAAAAECAAKEAKEKKDAAEEMAADSEKKEKEKADSEKKEKEMKDAAEHEEKERAKKDASNSETAELRARIDAMSRRLPAEVTAEERRRMVGYQSKAEKVAQAFGDTDGAPVFVQGESETAYRLRLLAKYQPHCKAYKDMDLSKVGEPKLFDVIEAQIYADALVEARTPSVVQPGVLIPQIHQDGSGRTITKYVGDPNACWNQFNAPYRHVRRILVPGSSRAQ